MTGSVCFNCEMVTRSREAVITPIWSQCEWPRRWSQSSTALRSPLGPLWFWSIRSFEIRNRREIGAFPVEMRYKKNLYTNTVWSPQCGERNPATTPSEQDGNLVMMHLNFLKLKKSHRNGITVEAFESKCLEPKAQRLGPYLVDTIRCTV